MDDKTLYATDLQVETRGNPWIPNVSRMKKDELKAALRDLKLNDQGKKDVLRKRLRTFYKKKQVIANNRHSFPKSRDKFYDYLCVVDFECTCDSGENFNYPHEIIEFPVILFKTLSLEIVDEFHAYCKPVINPRLSEFCSNLTGITQEQVDSAPEFLTVLKNVNRWLEKHELSTDEYRYAFVTDGPWDFGRFMQMQFQHLNMAVPHHFRYWINVRKTFCQINRLQKVNLTQMLTLLDMKFEGREHCGLDDARNVCRIVKALLEKGTEFRINEMMLRRDRLDIRGKRQQEIFQQRQAQLAQRNAQKQLQQPVGRENLPVAVMHTSSPDQNGAKQEDNVESPTAITAPNEEGGQAEDEGKPKHGGQFFLPYKVVGITKPEFLQSVYENCLTCDEAEEEGEEDDENSDSEKE